MSTSRQSPPIPSIVRLFGLATIDTALPDRLRDLATDITLLLKQRAPDAAVLKAAPFLDEWMLFSRPSGIALIGLISDHPTLRGPISMTSPIWVIAADLTWVRTTSRFYRLGAMKPVNHDQASEDGHVH